MQVGIDKESASIY